VVGERRATYLRQGKAPKTGRGLVSPSMNPLDLLLLPRPMASPFVAIDAIFNRSRDAAAILFLIEDSYSMVPLWQRLRDSYLPCLLNAIKGANPSAAVSPFAPAPLLLPIVTLQAKALWMIASEHAPFKPPPDPSACRTPPWDEIPAINFGSHGRNTISPANVTHAIEARHAHFHSLRSDI
jgi:hypothetical protein